MISNQVINSYFHCHLKAQYYHQKNHFSMHPISIIHSRILNRMIKEVELQEKFLNISTMNQTNLNSNNNVQILKNKIYTYNNLEIIIPYIEISESYQITPIFLSPTYNITKEERAFFSFKTNLLENIYKSSINFYKVILPNIKVRKIKKNLKGYDLNIEKIISENRSISKKKHCIVCEYNSNCFEIQKKNDDLRLLTGMRETEVQKWNNIGYFTITQLSYKFKPRRRNSINNKASRYKFELKALAIREKKTFVINLPSFADSNFDIFVDFEGLPDEKFVYLIGILIVENGKVKSRISFWANNKEFEQQIFKKLFNILENFKHYKIHHFGSYELKELRRFNKENNSQYSNIINTIENESINILKYFYSDIYPPTYSNGLKEIANYIGFNWTKKSASGLNSIVWRKKWEISNNIKYKQQLLVYNIEDCMALYKVKIWLKNLQSNLNTFELKNVINQTHLRFGKINFQLDSFNNINETAYFNYQRTKIYLRTEKKLTKKTRKIRSVKNIIANKKEYSQKPDNCPKCHNPKLYVHQKFVRNFIDLRFTKNGIKRWVIRFYGNRFRCSNCNYVFTDSKYYRQPTYGNNLRIWIIYYYMSYGISYDNLVKMLDETYNIQLTKTFISNVKSNFSIKYQSYYQKILVSILNSNLIHIDETTVKVRNQKGYIWVFTNMTKVYYLFRPNRETNFLKTMLKDFKGVLISDFYSGYDSLVCKQQKCLIHLLRDINDLVFQNQTNNEILTIAKLFGNLLQKIIYTIDKFGLKKRNLNKHHIDVDRFFKEIAFLNFKTKLALKLKKRLQRNQSKLFVFLDYDSIPWNNNNAEFAIKAFAIYRKNADGIYNENGLKDYLVMLSISKTCHYQNMSFLDILKNKSKMDF